MSRKQFYSILAIAIMAVTVSLQSCEREENLGVAICPSAKFAFTTPLSVSTTNVNMKTSKINILAGFNELVEWSLIIKGKTTGATKTYKGKSDSLNIDWYGNGETDKFFEAEEVSIDLDIACKGLQKDMSKTVTINTRPNMVNADFALFLTNYDDPGNLNTSSGWPAPATNNYCIKKDTLPTGDSSPEGGNCLRMRGGVLNKVNKVWYFGGYESSGIASKVGSFITKGGTTNPDSIFINMYIRGYNSTNPNSQLVFIIVSDNKNYQFIQNVDWDGWKMVSVNLSSLKSMYKFENFSATSKVVVELGAGPLQASKAELLVDFIILTAGAPYKEIQKRNY